MYYRDEDGFGMTDDDEINLEGAIQTEKWKTRTQGRLSKNGRTDESRIQGSNKFAPQRVIHSGCCEAGWKGREYGATNEKNVQSAIAIIKCKILRLFLRNVLGDCCLRAKNTTFAHIITTICLRSQFVVLKNEYKYDRHNGKDRKRRTGHKS